MSAATLAVEPPPSGAIKRPPPFFTYTNLFNAIGWLVLALIVWFLVIPAARGGTWAPFGEWSTWRFLLVGPDFGSMDEWKTWSTLMFGPEEERTFGSGILYFISLKGIPQLQGLAITLFVGVFAVVLSTIIGFFFALGRLSNFKPLRLFCSGYIELMRALPSYLIIFYVFIGFPKLLGINLAAPWFAIIGLTLYTSAVMAEIFRAGILGVDKGQLEAAYALGLKPRDTIVNIVLPQAVRRMVPSIVSQLITLTKDTSLASVIALQELTRKGKQLYEFYNNVLEMMFVVAAIYFLICFSLSLASKRLEIKQ